jgi:AraC-like DNA-binding protein
MSELIEWIDRFELPEGLHATQLKDVSLFKVCQYLPRRPVMLEPGICIVAQGKKIGYLGDRVFQYDENNYLVTSVPIPFECETFATPDKPILGIYIKIDLRQLHDLISLMSSEVGFRSAKTKALPRGIGPAFLDVDMKDAAVRLLKCLHSETECRILGPGSVREILFRALGGDRAPLLFALAMHNGLFFQVATALQLIHEHYPDKLDVEGLANTAGMSVSAFHKAFKEITSDSPMQYLKKFRLTRARDFIVQEKMKAYIAADKVGYESPSQFSREFKRYFGQNPTDTLRQSNAA